MNTDFDETWVVTWNRFRRCCWIGTTLDARRIGRSQYPGGASLRKNWDSFTRGQERYGDLFSSTFVGLAPSWEAGRTLAHCLESEKRFDPRVRFPELCNDPLIDGALLTEAIEIVERNRPKGTHPYSLSGRFFLALRELLANKVEDPASFIGAHVYPDGHTRLNEGDVFLKWLLDLEGSLECHFRGANGRLYKSMRVSGGIKTEHTPVDAYVLTWDPFSDSLSVASEAEARGLAFKQVGERDTEKWKGLPSGEHTEMNSTFIDAFKTQAEAGEAGDQLTREFRSPTDLR